MIGFTQVDLGNGVYAGFTSKFGGVSQAPYGSLNLGPNVQDAPEAVAENRAILAEHMGAPVVFSSQIHGSDFIFINDEAASTWVGANPPVTAGPADALITTSRQVGLGVLVADCVPVLLASPPGGGTETGIVATAHAGRRGVELNVIAAIVAQMRAAGAQQIKAAIGPAICGNCYEVPAEMRAEVAALEPDAWAETRHGTPGLDLPAAVADQLARAGVEIAYRSPHCTLESNDFYSHRRATAEVATGGPGATGRQAGAIRLLG